MYTGTPTHQYAKPKYKQNKHILDHCFSLNKSLPGSLEQWDVLCRYCQYYLVSSISRLHEGTDQFNSCYAVIISKGMLHLKLHLGRKGRPCGTSIPIINTILTNYYYMYTIFVIDTCHNPSNLGRFKWTSPNLLSYTLQTWVC